MARTLVIDTSGRACSVALLEDGVLLAERHEDIGRGHAEVLIPWIAALPEGGRADAILVGCGPGSFTGVRVGVAAARALALGWSVPVHGFPSLALIAADATGDGPVLIVTEGGHGELFIQPWERAPFGTTEPLCSLTPEDAAQRFEIAHVAGNAADRYLAAGGKGVHLEATTRAASVARLPAALLTLAPTPIYGRLPDAKPMAIRP